MTFRQKSKVRARPAAKTRLKSREAVWYNFPKEASTPKLRDAPTYPDLTEG